jgi:hypothetical protein
MPTGNSFAKDMTVAARKRPCPLASYQLKTKHNAADTGSALQPSVGKAYTSMRWLSMEWVPDVTRALVSKAGPRKARYRSAKEQNTESPAIYLHGLFEFESYTWCKTSTNVHILRLSLRPSQETHLNFFCKIDWKPWYTSQYCMVIYFQTETAILS